MSIIEFPINSGSGSWTLPPEPDTTSNIVPFSKDFTASYSSDDNALKQAIWDSKYHTKEIAEAIQDAKNVRDQALINAKIALEEAFAPKIAEMIQCSNFPVKNKSFNETKKLMTNFREKVAAYPKYISYEGSMVLCVLLSVNQATNINLNGLPEVDRKIIFSILPDGANKQLESQAARINVKFDNVHDFILEYWDGGDGEIFPKSIVNLFNTVIHPNPDSNSMNNVPVVNEGEKISLGGKITLDKKNMSERIGISPSKNKDLNNIITEEEIVTSRRTPVAGRNAFEIRTDVLEMALGFLQGQKKNATEDDVIKTAKKFYSFVENRSR